MPVIPPPPHPAGQKGRVKRHQNSFHVQSRRKSLLSVLYLIVVDQANQITPHPLFAVLGTRQGRCEVVQWTDAPLWEITLLRCEETDANILGPVKGSRHVFNKLRLYISGNKVLIKNLIKNRESIKLFTVGSCRYFITNSLFTPYLASQFLLS